MDDITKVLTVEASKVPMEDAPDNNESHTLSHDAIEFYNNRDAPYCYSRILGLNNLHTDFWGVLLGNLNDGRLYSIHIEGWIQRMMFIRGANKRENPSTEFDWTILPPQFHSEMYDYKMKFGSEYANRMKELYPPFCELLDVVSYWRRVIHGPYKPQDKRYLKTQHINDDYLPKNGGGLGKDSGIFCVYANAKAGA
ncbi:hypothetical protein R6Q59_021588 [Mikania micrantha]